MGISEFERLLARHRVTVRREGDELVWEGHSAAPISYEEKLDLDKKIPGLAELMKCLGLAELQSWIINFVGGPADGKESGSPVPPDDVIHREYANEKGVAAPCCYCRSDDQDAEDEGILRYEFDGWE